MKKHLSSIILILVFFTGLSVLLYPSISDYHNSKTQSRAIVDYESVLTGLKTEDYSALFEAADAYNAAIRKVAFPLMYHDEVEGYDDLLNVSGTGIIGYISIDKIKVELPIYHGTSDEVLNVAAGHLEGTSLPVGGESTHAALSAHRGLPGAKLFTNLDKMEVGDTFLLRVLDEVLTYEVDQIKIVEPQVTEDLLIEEGKDLCTLVTCTPYGINSHRMLVRGHRIETEEVKAVRRVTADAVQIEPIIVAPFVAAPMLLVLLIPKPKKKKEDL